jgi:hypothetical protein
VRRVQVANHQAHDAAEFVGRRGASRARAVPLARRFPVHAVEGRIKEIVAEQRPGLVEDDAFLRGEIDREFGGHAERARVAPLQVRNLNPAGVEIDDLFTVLRELRIGLRPRRRRDLARHRTIRRQLVESVRVEIRLARGRRHHNSRLAVGTDRHASHVEPDG